MCTLCSAVYTRLIRSTAFELPPSALPSVKLPARARFSLVRLSHPSRQTERKPSRTLEERFFVRRLQNEAIRASKVKK